MAVSLAIRDRRLVQSVVREANGDPKITDFELADQEWERNTNAQKRVNAAGGVDPNVPSPRPSPEHAAPRAKPTAAAGEVEGIATATERLKTAQANLAELEFAKAAGELVVASTVQAEWANLLSQVRTKLLAIPTRFRQEVPDTTASALALLDGMVREALEDLVASQEAS
jgi:hypothetical protein